jgi:hypothetical protein
MRPSCHPYSYVTEPHHFKVSPEQAMVETSKGYTTLSQESTMSGEVHRLGEDPVHPLTRRDRPDYKPTANA